MYPGYSPYSPYHHHHHMMQPGMPPIGFAQPMVRPAVVWMTAPPPIPGVPPGLEYLSTVDYIFVHQLLEVIEMMTGIETANRYVYYAYEVPNWNCQGCSQSREFTLSIIDNLGREVMRVVNPCKCCSCCLCCACSRGCCSTRAFVEAPPGNLIGSIAQTCSCCYPSFVVCNAAGGEELIIDSPPCCSGLNKAFPVFSMSREPMGVIQRQWSGTMREFISDADNFGVQFPATMDVHLKALLLGATFLIDFMVFEENVGGAPVVPMA